MTRGTEDPCVSAGPDIRLLDEGALLRRVNRSGDPTAREEVISRGLALVHHIARRYDRRGVSYEELVQVGSIGLINAVDRFDPDRGTRFSTFAVPHIAGEIRRHFRDHTWGMRVSRSQQENHALLTKLADQLLVKLQRLPTVAELAEAADLTVEQVLEARLAHECYELPSLDTPLATDDGASATRGDVVGSGDPGYARVDARLTVAASLRHLQRRERLILKLRFEDELTQLQIAEKLGISQMHVSRLLSQALADLRAEIDSGAQQTDHGRLSAAS